MRIVFVLFGLLPAVAFCQNLPTSLEVQMFNFDKVVVCLDGKQFDCCSKFKLSGISAGNHHLKVYKARQYVNPDNQTKNERLVPIYSGNIYLAKDQKTTCVINEYHQKEIQIRN